MAHDGAGGARELLKLNEIPLLNPRYNIAPSQDLP